MALILSLKKHTIFWPLVALILIILLVFLVFLATFTWPLKIDGVGLLLLKGQINQITSPMNGTIEAWHVEEGQEVKSNDLLLSIRLKDEQTIIKDIYASKDAVIAEILSYPGSMVAISEVLAITTASGDVRKDLELIGFVSSLDGKKIQVGMAAQVRPSISNVYQHGFLEAYVTKIGKLPMSKSAISSLIKIPELTKYIRQKIEAEPFVVYLSLVADESQQTGYQWSGVGPSFTLDSGVLSDISIIYEKPKLLSLTWPFLYRQIKE